MNPRDRTYPISPQDISCGFNAHRNHDLIWGPFTDTSARWIIAFLQERKKQWEPFTLLEIENYYQDGGYSQFQFNGLCPNLIYEDHGKYYPTHQFIQQFFSAFPNS